MRYEIAAEKISDNLLVAAARGHVTTSLSLDGSG